MIYLKDSSQLIGIEMYEGDGEIDYSSDFFNVSMLLMIDTIGEYPVYEVDSVPHCIVQAYDWQQFIWDYADDELKYRDVILHQYY